MRRNSALVICNRVRGVRIFGHDAACQVSGQYRSLYGGGGGGRSARSRSNSSSDVQMADGGPKDTDDYDGSPSPIGSRLGSFSPSRAAFSPSSPTSPATPAYGPPSPSGSAAGGSARSGGRSSQRPGQQANRYFAASRSPSNDSRGATPAPRHSAGPLFGSLMSRMSSPTHRPPLPPRLPGAPPPQGRSEAAGVRAAVTCPESEEEKAFDSAVDICKVRHMCPAVVASGLVCGPCWHFV